MTRKIFLAVSVLLVGAMQPVWADSSTASCSASGGCGTNVDNISFAVTGNIPIIPASVLLAINQALAAAGIIGTLESGGAGGTLNVSASQAAAAVASLESVVNSIEGTSGSGAGPLVGTLMRIINALKKAAGL